MANWEQGAQGALAGAGTGAAFGPWGAAAGGIIGGVAGLFGGGKPENPYADVNQANFNLPGFDQYMGDYNQALANGPNLSGRSGFARDQRQLANMLMAQAKGAGPGQQLAAAQAQQMADRGAAQQMAMAQASRGGMGALAGRNAAMQAANIQSRAGEQAMMGGLQAQLGAQGQLGGVLQGARGQDISQNQFNANLQFQHQAEMMRQRAAMAGMQQQGMMGYEAARTGRYAPWGAQNQGPTDFEKYLGAMGGLAQGVGAYQAGQKNQQNRPPRSQPQPGGGPNGVNYFNSGARPGQ